MSSLAEKFRFVLNHTEAYRLRVSTACRYTGSDSGCWRGDIRWHLPLARKEGHMTKSLWERVRLFFPILLTFSGILAVTLLGIGCQATPLSGAALLEARCNQCHTLAPVEVARKTPQEWEATVYRMIGKGARLSDDEARQMVEFLSETYGIQRP